MNEPQESLEYGYSAKLRGGFLCQPDVCKLLTAPGCMCCVIADHLDRLKNSADMWHDESRRLLGVIESKDETLGLRAERLNAVQALLREILHVGGLSGGVRKRAASLLFLSEDQK